MADPFAAVMAEGLNDRLAEILRQAAVTSRPSMANVHALLAYAGEAGVKEKFDKRFGSGSAAAIIEASKKADMALAVKEGLDGIAEKVEALAKKHDAELGAVMGRIESLAGSVSAVAQAVAAIPRPEPIDLDAMAAKIGGVIPLPLAPVLQSVDSQSAPVDLAPMAQALVLLVNEIKELQRLAKAPRRVIEDINGNVVGVRIEGA